MATFAEQMVERIEKVLSGRIDADVQSYSIAGRALTKIPVSELVNLRDKYRAEIAQERLALELEMSGKKKPRRIVYVFGS